jgi:transcription initiation factor TFIIIB Brf1 subunit/transcription initiation factor TFIIB
MMKMNTIQKQRRYDYIRKKQDQNSMSVKELRERNVTNINQTMDQILDDLVMIKEMQT